MAPRARVVALTAIAAGVMAAIAVAVAVGQRGPTGSDAAAQPQRPAGAPPLALDLGVRGDPEARALRRALALYDGDKRILAGAIFGRFDSLEARVGKAFADWPDRTEDRLERLGGLHARSAVVQLHLGIARIWSGRSNSEEALRATVDLAPDTQYAITAGNLLFPDFLPNLPRFVPSVAAPPSIVELAPAEQVDELRRLWRGGDRAGGLYYGIAQQRLGKQLSASRVFGRMARERPADAEVLTAAAVARFDKENPSAAFSRLGPLSRRFPHSATVRFHLGLLLLWSKRLDEAQIQLRRAVAAEPGSPMAVQAQRYLDTLRKASA